MGPLLEIRVRQEEGGLSEIVRGDGWEVLLGQSASRLASQLSFGL